MRGVVTGNFSPIRLKCGRHGHLLRLLESRCHKDNILIVVIVIVINIVVLLPHGVNTLQGCQSGHVLVVFVIIIIVVVVIIIIVIVMIIRTLCIGCPLQSSQLLQSSTASQSAFYSSQMGVQVLLLLLQLVVVALSPLS